MKNFIKIIIIVAILVILVFLSVGIVRIVPRVVSSLASATVSLGSFFTGGNSNDNATSTTSSNNTGTNTGGVQTATSTNGNGFVIINGTSTNSGSEDERSLVNILRPNSTSGQPTQGANNNSNTSNVKNPVNNSSNTGAGNVSYVANTCTNGRVSDLAVRVLSRGVMNRATGQYVETNSFTSSDTVIVKFIAENRGNCPTGTWSLRVDMPSQNTADRVRNIVNVASLPAGSTVTGEVNFTTPVVGNSNVTLTVTDNSGRDSNLSNNTVSTSITTVASNTGTNPGTPITGDGRPDLAVRILRMGTLGYNNQFITSANTSGSYGGNFRVGERIAMQFEVINQGQNPTGPWTWKADSVVFQNGSYINNQYENSIPAGGRLVYTIGFDSQTIGTNNISVSVDHLNQVNEFNESNNIAGVSFNVGY